MRTGFRSNCHRASTTPAHNWTDFPESLQKIIARMRGVIIENQHAFKVLRKYDSEATLHYVDPPYVHDTRSSKKAYRHEMTDADHEDLAELLHDLKGSVIVSGYNGGLYARLFKDWQVMTMDTHADGARPRTEVLWIRTNKNSK